MITGLCRLASVATPLEQDLEEFSNTVMGSVDSDFNGVIDYEEFTAYLNDQLDLQDFLLKYMQVPTFNSIFSRANMINKHYNQLFINAAKSNYSKIANKE